MIVDNLLRIGIPELSPGQWKALEKKLTFMKNDGDVVISYRRRVTEGDYLLPRGAWNLLPDEITYEDRRSFPPMPELNFVLKLDAIEHDPRFVGQQRAVDTMFREEQGLLIRPPGTGKTEIATAFMAKAKTRSLVLVHTEDILNQWVERVEKNIPELQGKVGVIRGKTCNIEQITIATVQTLYRSYLEKPDKWWRQFGAIIADEAHHVSAATWEAVLNTCPAYYRFGFTASPTRADGMHPTMKFIIGPIIHREKFSSSVKLEVVTARTSFKAAYRGSFDWGPLLNKLIHDERRNAHIARIADREVDKGNSVLVLSRRIEHLQNIAAAMRNDTEILAAATSKKKARAEILRDFKTGKVRCVLATQLADEALDVPILNRVLLTFPGKHEGRIIQQIGRAIRQHSEKEDAVIFDFVDRSVRPLRRQASERRRTYIKEGIEIRKRRKLKWR